jgi:hypothetical protein
VGSGGGVHPGGGWWRNAVTVEFFHCLTVRRCRAGERVGIGFCATSVGVWSSARKLINFHWLVLLCTEIKKNSCRLNLLRMEVSTSSVGSRWLTKGHRKLKTPTEIYQIHVV